MSASDYHPSSRRGLVRAVNTGADAAQVGPMASTHSSLFRVSEFLP